MSYSDIQGDFDPSGGSPKIRLIRRSRTLLLLVEFLLMVILWFMGYRSGMAPYEGLKHQPLLPLGILLTNTLFALLLMALTGIAFRAMEIHATESESQRYILANGSLKGAITTVVLAVILVLLVVWLPGSGPAASVLKEQRTDGIKYGDQTFEWESQDLLLLTDTTSVSFKVNEDHPVSAQIFKEEDAEASVNPIPDGDTAIDTPNGTTFFTYSNDEYLQDPQNFGVYDLIVTNNVPDTKPSVTYTVTHTVRQGLVDSLLLMGIIFIVLYGAWAAFAGYLRSKAKGQAIYT